MVKLNCVSCCDGQVTIDAVSGVEKTQGKDKIIGVLENKALRWC
ncbi:MAG: hypothetical protein ACLTDP_12645 [Terrisporobacter sp.]